MNNHHYTIAFFGGEPLSVPALAELKRHGILPTLVVCNPDRRQGRDMKLTPPPVKVWADQEGIAVLQPDSLQDDKVIDALTKTTWDLFVVVAYSAIIPRSLLDIPVHGVINLHPSLLPEFRGASPIRSAILNDTRETGVTIMLVDEKMDHGPILAQEAVTIPTSEWPLPGRKLDALLGERGAILLAKTIPEWLEAKIEPTPQDHSLATFTKKITKEMGELDLNDNPYQNFLKIRAFDGWPGTYFFTEKNGKKVRVKITDAELGEDGSLRILRVIPEGKKEMSYETFLKS